MTVTGTSHGINTTLTSVATAVGQTVNITPLTDLIVSTAAGQPGGAVLTSLCASIVAADQAQCKAALTLAATPANLNAAVTAVTNMIAPLNTANANPLNGTFVGGSGAGMDAVLDAILVSPATIQGAVATVTLTANPTQQLGAVTMPNSVGGAATTVIVTPVATYPAIVGTWSNAIGWTPSGTNLEFTFFANGDYMMAQAITPPFAISGAQPGLEHGTYTWNPNTGTLLVTCPTIDTNLLAGFSAPTGVQCSPGTTVMNAKVTVSGNTMTLIDNAVTPASAITLSRVVDATNPIVGTWSNAIGWAPSGTNLEFTFFANGDYMMAQATSAPQPGLEHGIYTWNPNTGALLVTCPTIDTNLLAGFSAPTGVQCTAGTTVMNATVTVSGNTMTLIDTVNPAATITLSRVTP